MYILIVKDVTLYSYTVIVNAPTVVKEMDVSVLYLMQQLVVNSLY